MPYFAEIDAGNKVTRVVVAPSADWCVTHLGGQWAATSDPYVDDGDVVAYCGPGYGFDPAVRERFCSEVWDAATATTQQPDGDGGFYWVHNTEGKLVWHEPTGKIWRNLLPTGTPNVWEPGVANWREETLGTNYPIWAQPTGSVDAYLLGERVEHNGVEYESLVAANVWEPAAVGSETLWAELTPEG